MLPLRVTVLLCASISTTAALAQEKVERRTEVPAHPVLALQLDSDIPWIRDPEIPLDKQRFSFGLTQKVDRDKIFDEALAKAKSTSKPVLWYVPRIVENKNLHGQQMYRAPVLDLYMRQVIFCDPDVAGIVASRFVPLRLNCDDTLAARFLLRPLEVVEPMVVVLDGDGRVLHKVQRMRTFCAHWFANWLRHALQRIESGTSPAIESHDQAVREGRWEEALALLEKKQEKTAKDWLTIAGLQRRLRSPEKAKEALEKISDKSKGPEIATELGVLATLAGATQEAIAQLEIAWRAPRNPRASEAGYLLAVNALKTGDETRALRVFEQVVARFPDDAYGRKAKANLTIGQDERPVGATFSGFEHVSWLPSSAYDGLPEDTAARGVEGAEAAAIARPAVEFLLAMQRDNGGFCDSRYAYWPSPDITPNVWIAITALSASALLEWRDEDPVRIDRALRRAEEFLFDDRRLARGKNEDVYADSYRLVYLARKVKRCDGQEKQLCIERMNAIVVDAAKRQLAGGFWAHEYPNAFATGAMLWGAYVARDAGAAVAPDMIEKGTRALLSARFSSGAFVYGGSAPKEVEESGDGAQSRPGRRRPSGAEQVKNASARMPACEGALFAFGKSDEQKIQAAYSAFWEYMNRLEIVRRNDFHSDGELAGFFFFHDLFHASEVNKLLPETVKRENDAKFRQILRRVPEMDGSFVDSHEIGRSYGTAMALLVLKNVS